ncbi:3-oxoadipyl-CoA thiolase [Photorhabdus laumondii]|uniref:3-oxoadipyl-CoA thiolase n=1 Tax=Photorhabdus laumondii TaxID=2218628 RepID=UPI000D634CB5|nr:3-oxoadipyl-CoA thiolase [Photorhabdus laumondii]AWK40150.1 beta-ketoadipyl CoA thiolase [Photorhabdus laumondii subsp. laumondii]
MREVFICDAIRTPIGRYGGALSKIRADDLGAVPLKYFLQKYQDLDWSAVDEVIYGCANQAGEDNRNVARMSALLAGLPVTVTATTVNRLCGSGMDAISIGARAIKAGEADLIIAGGVESMSRAPFVMGKAETPFSREANGLHDTTIGWRFINPQMAELYGVDSMPETAENVAETFGISRQDQDLFAFRSQQKAKAARLSGRFSLEIVSVSVPQKRGESLVVDQDEHLRPETTLEGLAKLRAPFRAGGSVTAGNASGVNDGACALILASAEAVQRHGLTPRGKVIAAATAGVEPRIMGFGPAPATQKLLLKTGISLDEVDLLELNEAFASQALATLRALGVRDDDERVNPNGGAIALGHPLGMSGARLVTTALLELSLRQKRYAICTMCIGVGQGIAILIERV